MKLCQTFLLVLSLAVIAAEADDKSAAPKRRLTIEDILARKTVHGRSPLAVAADGAYVAATIQSAAHNEPTEEGKHWTKQGIIGENVGNRVTILSVADGKVLDPWPADSTSFSPQWSPDGKRLAVYLRDGDLHIAMAVWDRESGKVKTFPKARVGVQVAWQTPKWLPDNRTIIFSHVDPDPSVPERKPTDPDIIVWRHDPQHTLFTEKELEHRSFGRALVRLDTDTGKMTTLQTYATPAQWRVSPDGKWAAYVRVAGRDATRFKLLFSFFVVPTDGSAPARELHKGFPGFWGPSFSWSPKHNAIAVSAGGKYTVLHTTGDPKPTVVKMPKGKFDLLAPPVWNPAGDAFYVRTGAAVWHLPIEGEAKSVIDGLKKIQWLQQGKYAAAVRIGADSLVWLSDSKGVLQLNVKTGTIAKRIDHEKAVHRSFLRYERVLAANSSVYGMRNRYQVFSFNLDTKEHKKLIDVQPQEQGIAKGIRQKVKWTLPNGKKREDPILLPPDYREGQRLPVVMELYGGGGGRILPRTIEAELLAAQGYAVFYPYLPLGRKKPLEELGPVVAAATDGLVASPYADPKRIGLMGQSYGCYTVLCILVQSDRYRTAIVSNGLSDLPHMFAYGWNGYCESGQGRMDATIWDETERYIKNSPYYALPKLKTPILLLAGSADRTNTRMLRGVYSGLQRLDRVVEYREFKGEPHGPGAWTAKHQRLMVKAITDWLGKTLKPEVKE